MDADALLLAFERAGREIAALEASIAHTALPLGETVSRAIAIATHLMAAYIAAVGKKAPNEADDVLAVFRALVKGDPSWHTVRDSLRELVYYRNCIAMGRSDALPPLPDTMTVRTVRHLYLLIKTRCLREGRVPI
ncbi:MAG: hypothetical protein M0T84_03990 [Betaproteobacteria bacterium]|nr:hypothetical protein [Betaproteobacteria bacterium]